MAYNPYDIQYIYVYIYLLYIFTYLIICIYIYHIKLAGILYIAGGTINLQRGMRPHVGIAGVTPRQCRV